MNLNSLFYRKFDKFVEENCLFGKGDKLIVGFSGGADSTALLLCLMHLRTKFNISLLAAYVNYNLRGKESTVEQEFVKKFCFQRNISLVIKNVKSEIKNNLENSARTIRFDYFRDLKKLYKFDKIVLAHTKDDQAETILYKLFRGSGLTGLKGILAKNNNIIHPLLVFKKKEITNFLIDQDIKWCEDSSNNDNKFSRNKIRNELIPWICENISSGINDKLFNTAKIFSETDDILKRIAERKIAHASHDQSKTVYRFSIKNLKNSESIIRFYIYRIIYHRLGNSGLDFYHSNFDEIESILDSKGSKMVSLPHNVVVIKEYNELIFSKEDGSVFNIHNIKEINSIRNRLTFEDHRIIFKKLKKLPKKHYPFEDKNTVYLDLNRFDFPLILRHRKPGDRFFPFGMEHPKKLKDFFIDEKVPKFERDKILLLCDKEKILWISGMRIDNRVALLPDSNNILMVRIEKIASQKARPAERIKN